MTLNFIQKLFVIVKRYHFKKIQVNMDRTKQISASTFIYW